MSRRPLLALALATAAALVPATPASAITTRPCSAHPGFGCTTLTVPLDHSGRLPGTLKLGVAVERPRQGADGFLVALSGGPGQPGLPFAESFRASLAPARRNRRLVVIDQRGTGAGGLDCTALQKLGSLDPVGTRTVEGCAKDLGPKREHFTTSDTVLDLEALRLALRTPKLDVMGVSYGTWVAVQYARRFPANVGRLILDSVVAPAGLDAYMLDTFEHLPRVLREQCGQRRCSGATADPVADLGRLVGRLGRGAVRGTLVDGGGGRSPSALHDQTELLLLMMTGDLNPFLQASLPGAVNAAVAGDTAELLRLRHLADGPFTPVKDFSTALNLTTTCSDTRLPYSLQQPYSDRWTLWRTGLDGVPDDAFAPFTRDGVLAASDAHDCLRWPQGDMPAPPFADPLPDVPALLISGRLDTRTPLENARALKAELPQGQLLVVGGTGHDVLDADITGCAARALRSFADGKAIGTPCRGKTNIVPVVARPPSSLQAYRSAPGVGGQRGRIVFGALETIADARLTVLQTLFAGFTKLQGGGLRRGSFLASDDGASLRLRGYSLVPGLRLSGVLHAAGSQVKGSVRVDGPGALDGRLAFDGHGRTTGTLGGRAVRYREPAAPKAGSAAAVAGRRVALRLPSLPAAVRRVRALHPLG